MKKLLLLVHSVFAAACFSQSFQWAETFGVTSSVGPYVTKGTVMTVDANGNSYTTGQFQGTVDFDPGPGVYTLTSTGTAIFVLKLNSSGNLVWAKAAQGSTNSGHFPESIAVDTQGDVYTTGFFNSTIDFDPGAGTYNLNPGISKTYLWKLDANGNFVWANVIAGSGSVGNIGSPGASNQYWARVALDASGYVYVTGTFSGTLDFDPGPGIYNITSAGPNGDAFILKLDPSDSFIWVKVIQGVSFSGNPKIDTAGNIYETGMCSGPIDFDPGPSVYQLYATSFMLKLDASGSFMWVKGWLGGGICYFFGLDVDAVGNVYATGLFGGTVDFDPDSGTNTLTSTGSINNNINDRFFLKLNGAGNFLWVKRLLFTGGPVPLAVDNAGNIVAAGTYSGTVDFDPGPSVFNMTSGSGADTYILKLDASCNLLWAGSISPEYGCSIDTDPVGNIYLMGVVIDTIGTDLNPGPDTFSSVSLNGYEDTYVLKLADCNLILTQPINQLAIVNTNVQFSTTSSLANASYQWQEDAGAGFFNLSNTGQYSGATTSVLTVNNVSLTQNNYYYRCIVSAADCSITSSQAVLNVNDCMSILPPVNQTVAVAATVQFITSSSIPNSTFLWQEDAGSGFVNLVNSGQYSGVTTETLTITGVSLTQNNNQYRCNIRSNTCSSTSSIAKLSVYSGVGIYELVHEYHFALFPNPSTGKVILRTDLTPICFSYNLTDQTGRQILNGKLNGRETIIDLTSLSAGLYLLQIDGQKPIKLVKE